MRFAIAVRDLGDHRVSLTLVITHICLYILLGQNEVYFLDKKYYFPFQLASYTHRFGCRVQLEETKA